MRKRAFRSPNMSATGRSPTSARTIPRHFGRCGAWAGHTGASGKLAQGIELLEQVHEKAMAKLGADNLLSRYVTNELASAYRAAGQSAKALLFLEKTHASNTAVFGPDHDTTLFAALNLGASYMGAGRIPEAVSILRRR